MSPSTLREQRFSNFRHFFMKDPLGLLEAVSSIGMPIGAAFHAAGGSLKHRYVRCYLSEHDRELIQELRDTYMDRYAEECDKYGSD